MLLIALNCFLQGLFSGFERWALLKPEKNKKLKEHMGLGAGN